MTEGIVVLGSMNMDLVLNVDRCPKTGETIISNKFSMLPGGKGANQAMAVNNLGGEVLFIGACGSDYYGERLLNYFKNNGVSTETIFQVEENTGIALITVDETGDNRIVLVPGANYKITPGLLEKVSDRIRESEILLLQLEIPLETVAWAIELANSAGTRVILDPAPACSLPEDILSRVDYLLPNEGELETIVKEYNLKSENARAGKLLELGAGAVIVTKGKEGITYYSHNNTIHIAGKDVKVVDTTGAGDMFAGALSYGLLKAEAQIEKVLTFANEAAALAVTKHGAQNTFSHSDYEVLLSIIN